MIKNIIFDIGGVLVDFNPLRVLKEMGLSEAAVQEIAGKTALSPLWSELDRGVMPRNEVFEKMINNVSPEYKDAARSFLYDNALKTVTSFDYSAGFVENLKNRGYKIFLLTNYPDWMFDYHFANVFTFSKFVDGMIVSGKVKLIKPDTAIYSALLAKYGLLPQESIFIDDRLENVKAANSLGIHGLQFTNYQETCKNLNCLLKE